MIQLYDGVFDTQLMDKGVIIIKSWNQFMDQSKVWTGEVAVIS